MHDQQFQIIQFFYNLVRNSTIINQMIDVRDTTTLMEQNQVKKESEIVEDNQKPTLLTCLFKWKYFIFAAIVLGTISVVLTRISIPNIFYKETVLFYPKLELPIHFIWVGSKPLPEKYAERLKLLKFPYKVLGEAEFKEFQSFFNFSADISVGKRADSFRLAYLWKYGGIYADFDNVIDYQCLMMRLEGLNGTYFQKEADWYRRPTINFIYASQPGDPILYDVIQKAHSRQNESTLQFLFGYMQRNYQLKSLDLDGCLYHQYDATWIPVDPNPY